MRTPLPSLIARVHEVREGERVAMGRAMQSQWEALVGEVRKKWPQVKLWDNTYLPLEPSFRLRLYRPDLVPELMRDGSQVSAAAAVLLVSTVAPVHHVYLALERKEGERNLSSIVQHEPPWPAGFTVEMHDLNAVAARFLRTTPVRPEWLAESVPENLGECLFGGHWW